MKKTINKEIIYIFKKKEFFEEENSVLWHILLIIIIIIYFTKVKTRVFYERLCFTRRDLFATRFYVMHNKSKNNYNCFFSAF